MGRLQSFFVFALTAVLALASEPAFAHHLMGGKLPDTFLMGLLSGLGHPIIGLDHLGAVIGVGLIAAFFPRGIPLILLFSAAIIGGVGLHLLRLNIPAAEFAVAVATLAIGAAVMIKAANSALAAVLIVLAGAIHGYALGESIVGAEQSPLFAYLLGLFVIQSMIAAGALFAGRAILNRGKRQILPIAGGAIVLVGLIFAFQASGLAA